MMPPIKLAIIDANVLAGIGLKSLFKDIMATIEVDIFSSFDEIEQSDGMYIHYFVSSRIYFEHTSFFRNNVRKTIVMVSGEMDISGVRTINVCQSEQALARSIMALMHHGHKNSAHAPHPTPQHGKPTEKLTTRETEVAVLLAKSFINKEIADKLNISITTVISHRKNIMEKINARSLADITIYCVLNGLVDIAEIKEETVSK